MTSNKNHKTAAGVLKTLPPFSIVFMTLIFSVFLISPSVSQELSPKNLKNFFKVGFNLSKSEPKLSRWEKPIKLDMRSNASQEINDFIISQILTISTEQKGLIQVEKDRPNFLLFITRDPQKALEEYNFEGINGDPLKEIQDTINSMDDPSCTGSRSLTKENEIYFSYWLIDPSYGEEFIKKCFLNSLMYVLGFQSFFDPQQGGALSLGAQTNEITSHDLFMLSVLYSERLHSGLTAKESYEILTTKIHK